MSECRENLQLGGEAVDGVGFGGAQKAFLESLGCPAWWTFAPVEVGAA